MSSSDYRANAREILAGRWGIAILVTFVAVLLGGGVANASFDVNIELDNQDLLTLPQFVLDYLKVAATIGGVLGLVQFIVGGTVQLGYCKFLLKLHDGQEVSFSDLFSEFGRFADGFVLALLRGIYIFLWTLLFIIPGIIAAYRYAMSPFILAENPGMTPSEAINQSKYMMDGHKGELFCLELSFFGWALLSALTLGIGSLWLNPYMDAAHAAFYRSLDYTMPEPQPKEEDIL